MDLTKLNEILISEGLERIRERVLSAARLGIRATASVLDDELALGASRLGGQPDVPDAFQWPSRKGKGFWAKPEPLHFLAQINLSEAATYDAGRQLPGAGHLLFFYDAANQPWGFDPKDRDGWRVIYCPDLNLVRRRGESSFRCSRLSFDSCLDVPPLESLFARGLELGDEEFDAYQFVIESLAGPAVREHKLLGHPEPVQGEMQSECQLASNGIYCGDRSRIRRSVLDRLLSGSSDWLLLFQVGSADESDMMWGDGGKLYFWIRKQDLSALRFDDVWMVLQCY